MIKVSVAKVARRWNPFQESLWPRLDRPITREEIDACPDEEELPKIDKVREGLWDLSSRENHIRRVAWLARHWSNAYPIGIDVGVDMPGHQEFYVLDGNHRLAAAIYLKRKWIPANVDGDVKWIEAIRWHGR